MNKNKIIILAAVALTVLLGSSIFCGYQYFKSHNKTEANNKATKNTANINTDDGDSKVDWDNLEIKDTSDDAMNITSEGTYTLTGNITGTVTINTEGNVKLILDNVTITSNDGPAIYVESAENVLIYLNDGTTNTLSDSKNSTNTELDSVIYSKDDLTFDGNGTLVINANYADGIVSKDDLKIKNGTYKITSVDDAIRGKDSVYILDGNFTINAGGDGIKSSNDTDSEKGYVLIENGTFNIGSKSDGIQAITKLVINNGTFDINSSEGLEATYIIINDGTVKINASDDGINASKKSTSLTPTIEVNGGNIEVTMGQGDTDGFDANGNIYINGGVVKVTGQSTFDYDGEGKINGGTVYVNGEKVTSLPNQMMGGGMMPGGMQGQAPNGQVPNQERGGMRRRTQ